MVATLMGGGAPFDSCYHFRGSPIMAGILRLSVLLYQELLIRIRLNLPSYVRSNNIGFLRYITPLLSRRLVLGLLSLRSSIPSRRATWKLCYCVHIEAGWRPLLLPDWTYDTYFRHRNFLLHQLIFFVF